MELTPTPQGSGCGGLVWAQLLQPLSTESACQLLKADIAKAHRTLNQRDGFTAAFRARKRRCPIFASTEIAAFLIKVHVLCFLGKTMPHGLSLSGSVCLHHPVVTTEDARILTHPPSPNLSQPPPLPGLLPGPEYDTLPLSHASSGPKRNSSSK